MFVIRRKHCLPIAVVRCCGILNLSFLIDLKFLLVNCSFVSFKIFHTLFSDQKSSSKQDTSSSYDDKDCKKDYRGRDYDKDYDRDKDSRDRGYDKGRDRDYEKRREYERDERRDKDYDRGRGHDREKERHYYKDRDRSYDRDKYHDRDRSRHYDRGGHYRRYDKYPMKVIYMYI